MAPAVPRQRSTGHLAFGQWVASPEPPSPAARQAAIAQRRQRQKAREQLLLDIASLAEEDAASSARRSALEDQVAAMRERVDELEAECLRHEKAKQEAAAKEAEAQEAWLSEQRPSLEGAISRLTRHRDAWRELCVELRRKVGQEEHELKELSERHERGVNERRRLQAECLSLQQECEDAQADLQDLRSLLQEDTQSLEKMAARRLTLEWTLEEHSKRQVHLQTALKNSISTLQNGTAKERALRELHGNAANEHCVAHRELAEGHRSEVLRLEDAAGEAEASCAELLELVASGAAEAQRLEEEVAQLEREKTLEEQQDASIRRTLEAVRAKKDALARRSLELHGLCKDIAAESMKLQEEHARLMLGRARRKALETLARAKSQEPTPVAPAPDGPAPGFEMAMCRGFWAPAGGGRVTTDSPLRRSLRAPKSRSASPQNR
ncbi:unnamed protein product [Symbiodinium sp. CCMP2592]|nr:unnamed protein product [Symbiodinium sp. CCMP2592]